MYVQIYSCITLICMIICKNVTNSYLINLCPDMFTGGTDISKLKYYTYMFRPIYALNTSTSKLKYMY